MSVSEHRACTASLCFYSDVIWLAAAEWDAPKYYKWQFMFY